MSIARTTEEDRSPIGPKFLARSRTEAGPLEQDWSDPDPSDPISPLNHDEGTTFVTVVVIAMAILALLPLLFLFLATFLDPEILMIPITPN